jgi:hypothetical protein
MMKESTSRRFGIRDLMVLGPASVVAFYLCLGLTELSWIVSEDFVSLPAGKPPNVTLRWCQNAAYFYGKSVSNSWCGIAANWGQMVAFWTCPWLITLGSAVAFLAIIPPRPPIRQVMRHPGVIASVAFVAAFAAFAMAQLGILIGPFAGLNPGFVGATPFQYWWINTCFALPRTAALAVAVSWITLAVTGRSLADRGSLDRLGTAIGCCWIGMGVIRILSSWLAAVAG